MKLNFLFLTVLFLFGLRVYAQPDSAETSVTIDANALKKAKPQVAYRLEIEGAIGLESQNFSTQQLLSFTTSDFLDTDDKNDLLNSVNNQFVLGYEQYWRVGIYEHPRFVTIGTARDNWGFSIYQRAYTALNMPRNTLDLALFGNKKFAGESLDLSDTYYENWFYTGLQYQFQFNIGNQPFEMASAIILGHSHSRYAFDDLSLYTEPDGAYLEVDGQYEIREHTTDFGFGIAGMGTAIDLATRFALNSRMKLSVGVSDLGIVYWTRGNSAVKDTSFRFSGIEISSVFDIKDSLIRSQVDELEEGISLNSNQYLLNLMPFRLEAELVYQMNKGKLQHLFASVDYLYLPGYMPRLRTGAYFRLNNKHKLTTEVGYGGFNALTLGAGYEWRVSNRVELNASVGNLPGVIVPALGMGTRLTGGITYHL
jgi:hypothetical protein